MLIEIHMLQNHSPSNLNRDDTGSPKEAVFGGFKRARISSQCIKRSIRRSNTFREKLDGHLAARTRRLPELVRDRLLKEGISPEMAEVAAKKASGFGTEAGKEQSDLKTAQTMFLTDSDISAVAQVMKEAAAEAGTVAKFEKIAAADLQKSAQLKGYRPMTVDIALFGRMITSEAFRDCEASAQVAHAISTHKVDHEFDYFTAVDDLKDRTNVEEDAGADMIGDVEFNSACYYKYFSIDFDGLVDNLTGVSAGRKDISDAERNEALDLALKTVDAFIQTAAMTTPSGKQNTFAAHQLPSMIYVELRQHKTPVNYANAFVQPAKQSAGTDLIQDSIAKFKAHVGAMTRGFNLEAAGRFVLAPEVAEFKIEGLDVEKVTDLNALCSRVKEVIANG